jgi:hypothetical protein
VHELEEGDLRRAGQDQVLGAVGYELHQSSRHFSRGFFFFLLCVGGSVFFSSYWGDRGPFFCLFFLFYKGPTEKKITQKLHERAGKSFTKKKANLLYQKKANLPPKKEERPGPSKLKKRTEKRQKKRKEKKKRKKQKKKRKEKTKKMDRLRSALTGVNVLIALASLALVLIVVSRIPRVRAFLASVMPKRPGTKPASANAKPVSAAGSAGPSAIGPSASGSVGAAGAGTSKKKNRPPVSDTESDEEREAMCRTRPVTLVALARPQQGAHGAMAAHQAAQVAIEEIHSDDEDDDEYYDDSDAQPRKELEKGKEFEKLEKELEKEKEKEKEEKEEEDSVARTDSGSAASVSAAAAAPARKRGTRRK